MTLIPATHLGCGPDFVASVTGGERLNAIS
jgi:hypothetical protein